MREEADEAHFGQISVSFFQRFRFLEPAPIPNMSGWDELFNVTEFAEPVQANEVSPVRKETSAELLSAAGMDIPYEFPDQLSNAAWPTDELGWQPLNSTQTIAGRNDDLESMIDVDHSLLDFSANAFVQDR